MLSFYSASVLANMGQGLMVLSLASVTLAFWWALSGTVRGNIRHVEWAKKSSLLFSFFILLAYSTLIVAFFSHDFSISYVYRYSERALPKFYLFCAGWGGQDGSLLFWTCLMSLLAAISLWHIQKKHSELFAPYIVVISAIQLFFTIVTFFAADPFGTLDFIPVDGKGLNPILQTPVMAIHPPNLYMGLLAFFVPYALGMAALIAKKEENTWIKATRPWSLLAWAFLTIGNMLGAFWAYNELGWGGFWAWDPVENAAFLPWLSATAFIHSAMIQEKQGMLKIWNMCLLTLTFFLCVFGTFLTRSGLISSIHSFARSDIGEYFVVFLVIVVVFSVSLIFARRKYLRSEKRLTSPLSRESSFLFNNALFSITTFIVFIGTTYPLYREWVYGTKATVGPPFFNRALAPVAVAFLSLMGVCALLGWVKTEKKRLFQLLILPSIVGVLSGTLFFGLPSYYEVAVPEITTRLSASMIFGLCAFVLMALVMEVREGVLKRQKQEKKNVLLTLLEHLLKMRRRYGGYLVHIGVVFLFVGFAAYGFHIEKSSAMAKGESVDVGDYIVVFDGIQAFKDKQKTMFEAQIGLHKRIKVNQFELHENKEQQIPSLGLRFTLRRAFPSGTAEQIAIVMIQQGDQEAKQYSNQHSFSLPTDKTRSVFRLRNIRLKNQQLVARLEWMKAGALVAKMKPARHKFNKFPEMTTEVALKTRLKDDFYAVLATWESTKTQGVLAHFKFYLNPLLFWLWFGGYIMFLGVVISGFPKRAWKPAALFVTCVGIGLFGFDLLTVITNYQF